MGTLRSHWYDRPGWPAGARYLTWHLLPDLPRTPALAAVIDRCGAALAGAEGLDPVPPRWLHMTVQGVGPADTVSAEELEAILAGARERLSGMPPLRLSVCPAEVVDEGVVVTCRPVERVGRLRHQLRDAMRPVLGADRLPGEDTEPVWPHLSLAYAHAAIPAEPLRAAVAELAALPVEVVWPTVSLLELRREGRLYCWDRLADVPVGPAAV